MWFPWRRKPAPTVVELKHALLDMSNGLGIVTETAGTCTLCAPHTREPLLSLRIHDSKVMVQASFALDAPAALSAVTKLSREFDWEFEDGFILNTLGTRLTGTEAAIFHQEQEAHRQLAVENLEAILGHRGAKTRREGLH